MSLFVVDDPRESIGPYGERPLSLCDVTKRYSLHVNRSFSRPLLQAMKPTRLTPLEVRQQQCEGRNHGQIIAVKDKTMMMMVVVLFPVAVLLAERQTEESSGESGSD